MRRLMNEAPQLNVRALKLDDNDLGGERIEAVIGEMIPRLELLTDLSICDARLGGPAAQRLLVALGAVPAFAKTHAEVWAPIPTVVQPPQGARLCLMRNNISDADLLPPANAAPVALCGVLDLALSGNPLITDSGMVTLGTLTPSVRKLYLGRCGVSVESDGKVPHLLETAWPMLECLALNGCPLLTSGFEALARSLHQRVRNVSTRKLAPPKPPAIVAASSAGGAGSSSAGGLGGSSSGGGLGAEPAHSYVHLDLREIPSLSPPTLALLIGKFKEYSKDDSKDGCKGQRWLDAQPFAGGLGDANATGCLVLRHDFEMKMTLRLCLRLEEVAHDGNVVGVGDGKGGPYYVEMPDVPQSKSLADLLSAVVQAANLKSDVAAGAAAPNKYQQTETLEEKAAGEVSKAKLGSKDLRRTLKEMHFPFGIGDPRGRIWHDRSFETAAGKLLPCGRADAQVQAATRVALGSLLHRRHDSGEAPPRRFDVEIGRPPMKEARRMVEATLTLQKRVPDKRAAAAEPPASKAGKKPKTA